MDDKSITKPGVKGCIGIRTGHTAFWIATKTYDIFHNYTKSPGTDLKKSAPGILILFTFLLSFEAQISLNLLTLESDEHIHFLALTVNCHRDLYYKKNFVFLKPICLLNRL